MFVRLLFLFFRLVLLNLRMMRLKSKSVPLGLRLNNPFNIRYTALNHWRGQIGSLLGFCRFVNIRYGVRAFAVLFCRYLAMGYNTPSKFIKRFAPSLENDTSRYIQFVCDRCNLDSDSLLDFTNFIDFARAVSNMEVGIIPASYRFGDVLNDVYFEVCVPHLS